MNANNDNITMERAAVQTAVTIKLGLDVHAGQITVCRQDGGLVPKPAQRKSWPEFLRWAERLAADAVPVISCYEAGPCGYGLHRQLTALGVTNYVVVPQRWDAEGQRVKTDARDALELCQRLDRYVAGNTKAFSVVRVPTVEQEQRRAVGRQRGTLVRERLRCVLRGHGLMLGQGCHAHKGWWEPKRWASFQQELPEWLRAQVQTWQTQAVALDEQVTRWSLRVEAQSTGQPIPKGVGELTAALLAGEILDWHRFANRRQVASYTGLCPSEHSSGLKRRQGGVSKHGNPRVRHQLVEACWRLLQWQPDYPPLRQLRAATGARARKRSVVAAARRLAIDLWRINTGQCPAEKLGLQLR
jgi:transposase